MIGWWKQSFSRRGTDGSVESDKGKKTSKHQQPRTSLIIHQADKYLKKNTWSLSFVDHVGFERIDGTILIPETMVWYKGMNEQLHDVSEHGNNGSVDSPHMEQTILIENIGIVKPNRRALKTQYAKKNNNETTAKTNDQQGKKGETTSDLKQQLAAVETISTSSSIVPSLTGLSRYMDGARSVSLHDAPSLSLRSTSSLSTAKKVNKSPSPLKTIKATPSGTAPVIPMVSKILTNMPSSINKERGGGSAVGGAPRDSDDEDSELLLFQDAMMTDEDGDENASKERQRPRSRMSVGSKQSKQGSRISATGSYHSWASISTLSTNPGRREMLLQKKRLIEKELAMMDSRSRSSTAARSNANNDGESLAGYSRTSSTISSLGTGGSLGSALSFTEKRITLGTGPGIVPTTGGSVSSSRRSKRKSPPRVIGPKTTTSPSNSTPKAKGSRKVKNLRKHSPSSSPKLKSVASPSQPQPSSSTEAMRASITQAFLSEFELPNDSDNIVRDMEVTVRGRKGTYSGEVLRSGTKTVPHTTTSGTNNKGLLKFIDNGEMYCGPFHHGEMHGTNGKYLFQSQGDIYKGDFHHNLRHGKAEFITGHGRRYVGMYDNDTPHGHGVLYNADGTVFFMGDWNKGKPSKPIKSEKERLEVMLPVVVSKEEAVVSAH